MQNTNYTICTICINNKRIGECTMGVIKFNPKQLVAAIVSMQEDVQFAAINSTDLSELSTAALYIIVLDTLNVTGSTLGHLMNPHVVVMNSDDYREYIDELAARIGARIGLSDFMSPAEPEYYGSAFEGLEYEGQAGMVSEMEPELILTEFLLAAFDEVYLVLTGTTEEIIGNTILD